MLRFRIVIEHEASGRPKLNAECLGTKEPWLSINRCIGSRPLPNDLKALLVCITTEWCHIDLELQNNYAKLHRI
jgi:hypothetical protein